jgi:molecular chaperone DnaK (HSP70)
MVVGCSRYDDSDIANLSYAHRDASRFAQVLRDVCGLPDDQILTLYDDVPDPRLAPTRANVLREISRGAQLARTGTVDLLFFFFSGHGFHSPVSGGDYFLLRDSWVTSLEDSSLSFDLVVRQLQGWQARHVLLFLDACRAAVAGGKAGPTPDLPGVDVAALCPPGMVSFCSCEPGRSSYEADELAAGVFTAGICEALGDQGKCRTIYELDAYLTRNVPLLSQRLGKPSQRPYTRVEPLGVQQLEVVSARKRNQWRAATPIGTELRRAVVPRGSGAPQQPLCAIDLGTSYSVAAVFDEAGDVRLIPSPEGPKLLPSVLNFTRELDYLVGHPALEAEQYRPETTVRHIKRALGTTTTYDVEGRSLAPELAASLIIRSLRHNAEEYLGTRVDRCLASYPANFSMAQENALQRAFDLADLEVERMIGEPNVASLTLSQLEPDYDGEVLVIDLGGGTFDVAIVSCGEGVNEIIAVTGSNRLGGLDYDEALASYLEDWLHEHVPGLSDPLPVPVAHELRREAERAKRVLGTRHATSIVLPDLELDDGGFRTVEIPIDRNLFRELTAELDRQVERTIQTALNDWRRRFWRHDKLDLCLLAGQGSKIFTVREVLERLDLHARVIDALQETAVVHGLSNQAGVLAGLNRDILLLNVLHRGLGIRRSTDAPPQPAKDVPEQDFGLISRDETRNTETVTLIDHLVTITTKRSEFFRVTDGDGPVPITVVQPGRSPDEPDELLGTFHFDPEGSNVQLEIAFDIDTSATAGLIVVDRANGRERRWQLNHLHTKLMGW